MAETAGTRHKHAHYKVQCVSVFCIHRKVTFSAHFSLISVSPLLCFILCGKMLLSLHVFRHLNTTSATSHGFVWKQFDFGMCTTVVAAIYFWAVCTTLCFALGFPASVYIIWKMLKTHRRTPYTPNDFFILNLSIMDATFLGFIPLGIVNHFFWFNWPLEATWNGIYALNTCGRPLIMACACIDCYLAVVHPIIYHQKKSLTPRIVVAAFIWTLTAACGITFFLFYKLYYTVFSIMPFIIAVVIIVFCDCCIVHTLKKSEAGKKNIHPQKQRAIQTLIYSLAMSVFSYLPPVLAFSFCLPLIPNSTAFMCAIAIPITLTSSLGAAIMPLLYLYNVGKLACFKVGCCKSLFLPK